MSSPAVFKHQVQVPWFDSAEWKFVYHEIFDDSTTVQRQQNALQILNVWKIRMPRLFSGVDGTLIILSASLEAHKGLPDEIVRQVQAAAVMRFLNICVVNQTKGGQETLFQTARNKKLPDWLINLRHDFAHAQRIPSRDMLNRALTFSLNWLKSNYWNKQYSQIKDYKHSQPESSERLKEFIGLYGELVLNFQDANCEDLKEKLGNQLKKFNVNIQGNLYSILGQLAKSQTDNRNMNSYKMCETILANGAIFSCITNSEDDIPANITKLWFPMFGTLHYFNHLLRFISLLVRICCLNQDCERSRKAAMWLGAISKLLLGPQRKFIIKKEDDNFDRKFWYFVNEIATYSNPYMNFYLKNLMIAADCDGNFIADVCQGIEAFNTDKVSKTDEVSNSKTIYTLDHVRKMLEEGMLDGIDELDSNNFSTWEPVHDMFMFAGIPIGQSPDQNYHPVLSHFKKS